MNPEVIRAVSRRQDHQVMLARICWNLSNRLSGGNWADPSRQRAYLKQGFTELVDAEDLSLRMIAPEDESKVTPTFTDIMIEFDAEKYSYENEEDLESDEIFEAETYKISSTVGQPVDEREIPIEILDKIFAEHGEEDEEESQNVYDAPVLEEVTRGDLAMVDLHREQETFYEFDEDADLIDYQESFRILFDGQKVFETRYGSEDGTNDFMPLYHDNELGARDGRPYVLTELTPEGIKEAMNRVEEEWNNFIVDDKLKEEMELSAQTTNEHRRRAMGMIALLTTDLFSFNELTKRRRF